MNGTPGMLYMAKDGFLLDSSAVIGSLLKNKIYQTRTIIDYFSDFGAKALLTGRVVSEIRHNLSDKGSKFVNRFDDMISGGIFYVEECPECDIRQTLPTVHGLYHEARERFEEFAGSILDTRNKTKRKKQRALQNDIGFKMLTEKLIQAPAENMDRHILAVASILKETKYPNMYIISTDTHFVPIDDSEFKTLRTLVPDLIMKKTGVLCRRPDKILEGLYEKEYESLKLTTDNL